MNINWEKFFKAVGILAAFGAIGVLLFKIWK